jgi:hypothetical protein
MVAGNMQVVADVARIISQAEGVFGSRDKTLLWLRTPDDRLDDRTPLKMLITDAGGRLIENMLWQIEIKRAPLKQRSRSRSATLSLRLCAHRPPFAEAQVEPVPQIGPLVFATTVTPLRHHRRDLRPAK